MQPKVFVIILNYNGKDVLTSCLASVYQSSYLNFEVVVVDNSSTDDSFEVAKKQFSRAHFIKNSANLGFACGNNLGIRFALEKFADYVLILNNDACLKKNTLFEVIKLAQEKKVPTIINPIILNAKGKQSIWFAGGEIQWLKMKTVHLTKVFSKNAYETQYCTGCAMLIAKEIFKKIGLFDERYFLYYEDSDFSVRAEKAGFGLYICPSAKVLHQEQSCQTNELKTYWLVLSGILFFQTQGDFFQKSWFFFYLGLRKLKNLFLLILKPSKQVLQVRQAYKDFRKIKVS